MPFFAGLQVFDAKGKEGKANTAVIDKLVEAGALLARGRMTHSYPHSWRSKRPGHLPQHPAVVRRHRPAGSATAWTSTASTIRERALTSIDRLVAGTRSPAATGSTR